MEKKKSSVGILSTEEIENLKTMTPIALSKSSTILTENSFEKKIIFGNTPKKNFENLNEKSFQTPKRISIKRKIFDKSPKSAKTNIKTPKSDIKTNSKKSVRAFQTPKNRKSPSIRLLSPIHNFKKSPLEESNSSIRRSLNLESDSIEEGFQDLGEKLHFLARHNRQAHSKYRTDIDLLNKQLEDKSKAIEDIKSRQESALAQRDELEKKVDALKQEKENKETALSEKIKQMKEEQASLQRRYLKTARSDYDGMNELNKKLLRKSRLLNKTESRLIEANRDLMNLIKNLSGKISNVEHSINKEERDLKVLERTKSHLATRKNDLTLEFDKMEKYLDQAEEEGKSREPNIDDNNALRNETETISVYHKGLKMVTDLLGVKSDRHKQTISEIENSFYKIAEALSENAHDRYRRQSFGYQFLPNRHVKATREMLKSLKTLKNDLRQNQKELENKNKLIEKQKQFIKETFEHNKINKNDISAKNENSSLKKKIKVYEEKSLIQQKENEKMKNQIFLLKEKITELNDKNKKEMLTAKQKEGNLRELEKAKIIKDLSEKKQKGHRKNHIAGKRFESVERRIGKN